ncbi:MAG TPA: FG-GAP repeat protein, partial [Pseudomonadota bacterium]|nr:FG-GAP repeat protein [Pseudomonadota bacterium]
NNSATNAGAVYVFERSGTSWSQQAYLKASNTDAFDYFGYSVAIFDNTLLVGAFNEDSNSTSIDGDQGNNAATNAGAAYVFERSGSSWSQQAYLKASNTNAYDYFGYSVAISGDTVVVAARDEDSNSTGIDGDQGNNAASASGAAYVFVRDSGNWSQQTYLKASNTGADDNFGFSVAISGDTAVIGATDEDSNSTIINGDQGNNAASYAGAAYVFQVLQDDVFKNGFEGT